MDVTLYFMGTVANGRQQASNEVYSLALFGDRLPLIGWLGMGLIIVSGITATALRTRAIPNAPAEEH